ncbi:hypothetical protein HMSSN139_06780 [Paenibacillus sp. HMSSN-139]|nr:hypothetical protein HMSSN139_06780 [Paenibacillus sp. HMSSN-139]
MGFGSADRHWDASRKTARQAKIGKWPNRIPENETQSKASSEKASASTGLAVFEQPRKDK